LTLAEVSYVTASGKEAPMATETTTDDDFETLIKDAGVPVLVDFWAEWCGPCKQMTPHLEAAADELAGQVRIVKLNVDDHPLTGSRYGLRGLPTLMLFKEGKIVARRPGQMNQQAIIEFVRENS
jgi:thioredoxin 1